MNKINSNTKIAIIGLGYVGLPLAVEFAKKFSVLGFDTNKARIDEIKNGTDFTLEVPSEDLNDVLSLNNKSFSSCKTGLVVDVTVQQLKFANVYIITVPTPIDKDKKPDLRPLLDASKTISKVLNKGDLVIYESTVYPGCTEEDCVPILESFSGLKYNEDFFCGYSPERINSGDKINTLTQIKKVTSGSNPKAAKAVDNLYRSIITAGTHLAPNIKVAEASKAIENAQRDLNISFVNELALIFDRMGVDTMDVIEAASTKWNFFPFKPGLVGGHCISVDPYYLTFKSESLGYHPSVVSSGRKVNDQMGGFVGAKLIQLMEEKKIPVPNSNILILGITFKENCSDIRNTKVIDVYKELKKHKANIDIYDPWANKNQVKKEFGINLLDSINNKKYNAVVLTVAHKEFRDINFVKLKKENVVIYDTKAFIDRNLVDGRL